MKIVQVFDFFSPMHGGGIVSVMYQLSKALAGRKHDVTIITTDFEIDKEYINSLKNVKVCPIHSKIDLHGFHYNPEIKKELSIIMKGVDIVHFQCYRSYQNIVMFKYLLKNNIPYIIDSHGTLAITQRSIRKKIYDIFWGKIFLLNASAAIAETDVGIKEYIDMGFDCKNIYHIPPGFNTDEFSHLVQPGGFKSKYKITENKIIVFLGRINHIKGVDFLLESFVDLIKNDDSIKLVLAGPDDGFKEKLMETINFNNIQDKVLFTGFLSEEDKKMMLVDASVVIQPSRYENGIAWTTIEALMSNTPVIVSSNTGAAEDIEKMDGGYLVEFGNKNQLISVINKVFNNKIDADKKVKNAKKYIYDNLSLKKRVIDYENLYKKIINKNVLNVESHQ